MEADDTIVTWCVGHLVTMCYPDAYDPRYKKWSLTTIPFLPDTYKYEVISGVKKQFGIVKKILTDKDVDTIYICTDSGREGEYIYRLVAQEAGVRGKKQLRVWIDSQTREEILRGIREARDDSEYDALGAAAYLRAKEDYLMGINFSRALTLKYGDGISRVMGTRYSVIAVGRVMTCVLGMVVRREREIRDFVKTPFYRILGKFCPAGDESGETITAEWHAVPGSRYFGTPALYKENGFKERKDAEALISELREAAGRAEKYGVKIRFEHANFCALSDAFSEQFDIVIAMDNALPHMLTREALRASVESIVGQIRPGGILVASIRDYDSLLAEKPPYSPPYIHKTDKGQRVSFQTWEWSGRNYRLTQYIIEDEDSLQISKFVCEYRAACREELTDLLLDCGCREVAWKFPEETGFYQPIVVAVK